MLIKNRLGGCVVTGQKFPLHAPKYTNKGSFAYPAKKVY